MRKETITWIDPDDELPDEGLNVMVFTPLGSEPVVQIGFLEDGIWSVSDVVAWAEMPCGPKRNEEAEE